MDMKADETFSGIYSNATALTKWLSTRNYAELVSGSAFDTEDLIAGRLDLFINIPLKTLDSTPALAGGSWGPCWTPSPRPRATSGIASSSCPLRSSAGKTRDRKCVG